MLTGSIARLALSWQYKSQASYVLRRTRLLLSLPVNICVYICETATASAMLGAKAVASRLARRTNFWRASRLNVSSGLPINP